MGQFVSNFLSYVKYIGIGLQLGKLSQRYLLRHSVVFTASRCAAFDDYILLCQ